MTEQDYTIAANVIEPDKVFRLGTKVWVQIWGGCDGVKVIGLSRGRRTVTKWVPRHRLDRFRAKWARPGIDCWRGDKASAEKKADWLQRCCALERADSPNRRAVAVGFYDTQKDSRA